MKKTIIKLFIVALFIFNSSCQSVDKFLDGLYLNPKVTSMQKYLDSRCDVDTFYAPEITKLTPLVTFFRDSKEITFSYLTNHKLHVITTIKPDAIITSCRFNPQNPSIVTITTFESLNGKGKVHIYDIRTNKKLYTLATGEIKDIQWSQDGTNLDIKYMKEVKVHNFFCRHTIQTKYFVDQIQIFTAAKPAALIVAEQKDKKRKSAKQQKSTCWRKWTIIGCTALLVAAALLLRK